MPGSDEPGASPPEQMVHRHWRKELFESLLVSGAVVTGALSTGWPENFLQWALLIVAAILGGLAPRAPLRNRLRAGAYHLLRRLRPTGLRRPLVFTLVLIVAATLGRVLVGAAPTVVEWTTARLFGCPNPIELRVLAAPEGLATARELTERFVKQAAGDHHGCAPVRFYVYAQPSGTAQRALARGWSANDLRALGPRPDVWLPGSPQHTLVDSEVTSNGLLLGARSVVLASTPVVLAIPKSAVPAELDAKRTDLTPDRGAHRRRSARLEFGSAGSGTILGRRTSKPRHLCQW